MPLGPDTEGISKRQNTLLQYFIKHIDASIKKGVFTNVYVRTGLSLWLDTLAIYDHRDFTEDFWTLLRNQYTSSGWKGLYSKSYNSGYHVSLVKQSVDN